MAIQGETGYAQDTTLVADITATALTFTLTGYSNWPSGASDNFVVIIGSGTTEEHVLCSKRVAGAVTVLTRGYRGTTAASHVATTTVTASSHASRSLLGKGDFMGELLTHLNATDHVHGATGQVGTSGVLGAGSGTSLVLTAFYARSVTDAITASATVTQAGATALTTEINRVVTIATTLNAVVLPAALAGRAVTVINAHATSSVSIFPALGDDINALAVNAQYVLLATKTVTFFCAVAGVWNTLLSA
jgi:hypothetical protein